MSIPYHVYVMAGSDDVETRTLLGLVVFTFVIGIERCKLKYCI
jgi:hypothetical protein